MKIIPRLSILLFASIVGAFAQPTPQSVARNLIFEGNFVEFQGDIPEGWSPGGYAGGDHGNAVKVTEDRDGNYVTLFIPNSATANFNLTLKEQVALRPTWTALVCSVDLRVFNYDQGKENYYRPRLHITFLDTSGKELVSVGVSLEGRYTDAWQTAERKVPIPAGANSAKIWLGTYGATGQLEFRNPYIAPVESAK